MTSVQRYDNFIDGAHRPPAEGRTHGIVDPSTERLYAEAPISSQADVDHAMRAATRAFEHWHATPPSERQLALLRFADAVEEHAEELLTLECRNTGKPRHVTAAEEMTQMLDQIRFLAGAARCLEGKAAGEYMTGHTSFVRREPIGVCAQITPWNYPMLMAVWKLAPAVAAGNTVVLKPAETTPITTLRLAELAAEFLPPGVLNVVCGERETGRRLAGHPASRMVSITGSVRAGKDVAATAAGDLKRVHLELGGKAPVIVFGDADVPAAAAGICAAGYFNAGQDCASATRVLADRGVHDDLVAELTRQAKATRTGGPDDEDADYGPLNNPAQLERVAGFVDRLPGHARVQTGGERVGDRGYFYAPTVISGAAQDDEIIQDEVFGPVITVQPFAGEEHATALANDVEYGLTSSVWTRDHARATRMSGRLDFGCVWINTHLPVPSEMPHGGFKHSGYGKDLSLYSLEDYTRVKHVLTDTRS